MKKHIIQWLISAALLANAGWVHAAAGAYPLDRFPAQKLNDLTALQNGAKLFVNYCLNCHGASALRYNRLQELGLSEEQIKENLLFTTDKVGDLMTVNLKASDAKNWLGVVPPDLSLTARSRASNAGSGPDWIYTYLRSFYRDSERPSGWNNLAFENVGMPHVLWGLQGTRSLQKEQTKKIVDEKTGKETWHKIVTQIDNYGLRSELKNEVLPAGAHHEALHYQWLEANAEQTKYYDNQVADLVAFMTWMAEPQAKARVRLGVWVLLFLFVFTVFAWGLNRAYWKDIH